MSHAVLATASASPTSTPSKRFPTTIATAVTPSTITSPRCPRHSTRTSRTGTNSQPACTSNPASAAAGTIPRPPAPATVSPSSHPPPGPRRRRNEPEDPGHHHREDQQPHPVQYARDLGLGPGLHIRRAPHDHRGHRQRPERPAHGVPGTLRDEFTVVVGPRPPVQTVHRRR